jgi:hypothetical protein
MAAEIKAIPVVVPLEGSGASEGQRVGFLLRCNADGD